MKCALKATLTTQLHLQTRQPLLGVCVNVDHSSDVAQHWYDDDQQGEINSGAIDKHAHLEVTTDGNLWFCEPPLVGRKML